MWHKSATVMLKFKNVTHIVFKVIEIIGAPEIFLNYN